MKARPAPQDVKPSTDGLTGGFSAEVWGKPLDKATPADWRALDRAMVRILYEGENDNED
jgi:hypothetical protein